MYTDLRIDNIVHHEKYIKDDQYFRIICTYQNDYDKILKSLSKYKNLHLAILCPTNINIKLYSNVISLSLHFCGVKSLRVIGKSRLIKLYLPRKVTFDLQMFPSLKILKCFYSTCDYIPTINSLVELHSNCVTKIAYQPNLEDLYISETAITVLPDAPKLKLLVCNDTPVDDIPLYKNLEYLLCFDTNITSCGSKNIKYIFSNKTIECDRQNIIEYYDDNEHFIKNGYSPLLTYIK